MLLSKSNADTQSMCDTKFKLYHIFIYALGSAIPLQYVGYIAWNVVDLWFINPLTLGWCCSQGPPAQAGTGAQGPDHKDG